MHLRDREILIRGSLTRIVTPRSHGYEDVTVTYIRRSKIPSHIYVKHQYR